MCVQFGGDNRCNSSPACRRGSLSPAAPGGLASSLYYHVWFGDAPCGSKAPECIQCGYKLTEDQYQLRNSVSTHTQTHTGMHTTK